MFLALSDQGYVQSLTTVSDGGGGGTASWTNQGTVDCRIDPLSGGGPDVIGGRIDENSTHVVTISAGGTIETDARFVIIGRGTFEVTAIHERTAEWVKRFEVIQIS
jgi:hypothetical protein